MSPPTRLLLVRHAEPDSSVHGCVYGRLDVGLSPQGVAHADRLAGAARRRSRSPRSTRARCGGPSRPPPRSPPRSASSRRSSRTCASSTSASSKACPSTTVAERFPDVVRWTDAPAGVAFPGGEAVADLRARALRAVRELIDRHEGETVAAVSHAMVIRAVLADALEMPPDALFRLGQDYGGISMVDWFGPLPIVQLVNAVEPLAGRLRIARMSAYALELDGVLGDTRPLWDAWLVDVSRRAHVDPTRLDDELPNWRSLLERFAEDHAPVYLRPSAPATAALRRLQAEGSRVGVFTDAPEELARVAVAHLGRRPADRGARGRARVARAAADETRAGRARRALADRLRRRARSLSFPDGAPGAHRPAARGAARAPGPGGRGACTHEPPSGGARRPDGDRARAARAQRVAAGARVRGARAAGPADPPPLGRLTGYFGRR